MEIWDPTHDQRSQRGIMMSYLYEARAKEVAQLEPSERIRYFADLAEQIHPAMPRYCEGGTCWSWHEDVWQRGAYPVFRKGELQRFHPHLSPPKGRFHFAGDVTSNHPGWMHGAIGSGLRAVDEVNRAV